MNKFYLLTLITTIVFFSGCSTRGVKTYNNDNKRNYNDDKRNVKLIEKDKDFTPTSYSEDKNHHNDQIEDKYRKHPTMNPYVIRGVRYYPTIVNVGDEFSGNASWYGPDFHGKHTSNGETYNMYDMTAAHKSLPMNTIVKVTNEKNGQSAVVRINDRGPFIATRIIDLSRAAAQKIDMLANGTAPVTIEVLGFASKNSSKSGASKNVTYSTKSNYNGGFALQIASFSRIEGAITTQEKYDNQDGYRTIIKDIESDNGRMFKVWLKGFKSEDEARDYKDQSEFSHAFIVRED